MKFQVQFTYTESGSLQVEAKSQTKANNKVFNKLMASGLDELQHEILSRDWFING